MHNDVITYFHLIRQCVPVKELNSVKKRVGSQFKSGENLTLLWFDSTTFTLKNQSDTKGTTHGNVY